MKKEKDRKIKTIISDGQRTTRSQWQTIKLHEKLEKVSQVAHQVDESSTTLSTVIRRRVHINDDDRHATLRHRCDPSRRDSATGDRHCRANRTKSHHRCRQLDQPSQAALQSARTVATNRGKDHQHSANSSSHSTSSHQHAAAAAAATSHCMGRASLQLRSGLCRDAAVLSDTFAAARERRAVPSSARNRSFISNRRSTEDLSRWVCILFLHNRLFDDPGWDRITDKKNFFAIALHDESEREIIRQERPNVNGPKIVNYKFVAQFLDASKRLRFTPKKREKIMLRCCLRKLSKPHTQVVAVSCSHWASKSRYFGEYGKFELANTQKLRNLLSRMRLKGKLDGKKRAKLDRQ